MKRTPNTFLVPIGAAVTAGVALWLSRASFDVAGTTLSPVRVAMLPSLAELMGFVALALLVAAGMASMIRGSRAFWAPATDALLPLFALSLLIVPYLPWLADWIPALRLFAGPARILIWFVVVGQVLWLFLPHLSCRLGLHAPVIGPTKGAALFAIVAVALSAPFVLNAREFPSAVLDLMNAARGLPSATPAAVPAGMLGVLFDQEYGILAYAPVLVLGFIGLGGMLRERSRRGQAIALSVAAVLLIVLPATVDPWWARSMMPGRPALLLLPLLVIPIAWLYSRLEVDSPARAGAQALLLVSVAVMVCLVVFTPRVSVLQEGDGSSTLLQWLSPTWQLWREAPTFIAGVSRAASVRVLLWLAGFGVATWWLINLRGFSEGRAALATSVGGALLCITIATISAAVVPDRTTRFDVEGRVTFPLLETFDPVARPIALRYEGFPIVSPDALPPLFAASAVSGQRTDRQPVRVVLNARFRLPAGRYVLDLKGSDAAASMPPSSLSLQLGREGRPIESWPLTLAPGQRSRRDFDVPLDAEFVGFRATRQAEQAIAELRVSPRSVVESRKRVPAGTVLAAATFAPVRIFFHDSLSYPETEGFWVKGRATARMTMLKVKQSDTGVLLAVHSGARPNVVTLTTPDWSQKLELVPGMTQRVLVPSNAGDRFIPLTISSADGFVPAEVEPGSSDPRLLGAWIAFIPDDIARTSAAP
ncbi:MAG TPA: hypothetical protein VM115_00685 [Vicinamibacterales bacterium]|nr:hypothetical protein [Vicinamibacterales bacterium]